MAEQTQPRPGPWAVGSRYGDVGVEVVALEPYQVIAVVNRTGENRRRSLEATPLRHGHSPADAERRQAELDQLNAGIPIALANARLFAAAPDLLDALRDMRNQFFGDEDGPYGRMVGWRKRLRDSVDAAIAKATGGAAS